MNRLTSIGTIAFLALFVLSIIQLSLIQIRMIAEHGIVGLIKRKHSVKEDYWLNLTVGQRFRLWLGFGVFVLLWVSLVIRLFL